MGVSATYADEVRPPTARLGRRLPEVLAWGALLALALWAAAPVVYLLVKATANHESLSGGDSLFAADQLQYLAWIRGAGQDVLAGNGFDLRAGGNVFLHPMFAISGVLWRSGMNIALSFLVWLPVAVGVLYAGFRRFTFQMLSSPMARTAALVLALFFVTPADPLAGWTVGSNGLGVLGGELAPTGALYGYFPIAIAVGLLALFMLGVGSIVEHQRGRRARGWYITWTAVAGLIIAWLHPWQGASALIVVAAVLVLGRFRRSYLPLLIPAAATALPLGYYLLLSRIDTAWKIAQLQSPPGRQNFFLLVLALLPFLPLALVGLRSGARAPRDRVLWLWPMAALLVYFVTPEYAPHALEGIDLPLTVLAVRGWRRLQLPAWLAVGAIAVATVPGLVFTLRLFHEVVQSDPQALLLHQDERKALAYLARDPAPGGVLPSLRISAAIPAYTGRRTWIGHALWTRNYPARADAVSALFSGQLSGAAARHFLHQVGARYLLADCEQTFDPRSIGPLVVAAHRFGCVDVYELAVPNRALPF